MPTADHAEVDADPPGRQKPLILRLPSMVAGRDLANRWLRLLATEFGSTPVLIDATRTAYGSVSFATQVVQRVLVEGEAASLTVAGAPTEFVDHFRQASAEAGVADRLLTLDNVPDDLRRVS